MVALEGSLKITLTVPLIIKERNQPVSRLAKMNEILSMTMQRLNVDPIVLTNFMRKRLNIKL